MRLELYIRGHFYISNEITLPEKEDWMDFKDRFIAVQEYTKLMVRSFKNKYAKAIENQDYEIYLVATENIYEPILN